MRSRRPSCKVASVGTRADLPRELHKQLPMLLQPSPTNVAVRTCALPALLCLTLGVLGSAPRARADAHNLEGRWVLSGDLNVFGSRGRDAVAPADDWSVAAFGAASYYLGPQLAVGGYSFFARRHFEEQPPAWTVYADWDTADISAGLHLHLGVPVGLKSRILIWPTAGYAWSRSKLTVRPRYSDRVPGYDPLARDAIFASPEPPAGELHRFEAGLSVLWAWRLSESVELALGPGVLASVLLADSGTRPSGDASYAATLQTRINYLAGPSAGTEARVQPSAGTPFARRGDWLISGHFLMNAWQRDGGRQAFTPTRHTEFYQLALTADVQRFVADAFSFGGSLAFEEEFTSNNAERYITTRRFGAGIVGIAHSAIRGALGFACRASLVYSRQFGEDFGSYATSKWRGQTMSLTLNPMLMMRIASRLAIGVGPYATGKDYVGSDKMAGAEAEIVYGLSAAFFGTVGERAPHGGLR